MSFFTRSTFRKPMQKPNKADKLEEMSHSSGINFLHDSIWTNESCKSAVLKRISVVSSKNLP